MSYYYAGLDIGQAVDFTALSIVERIVPPKEEKAVYHVRHLERVTLGVSYPEQVERVKSVLGQPALKDSVTMALDYTGVGRPVADMFKQARLPCALYLVSIHGGDTVQWDEKDKYHARVPKRTLVSLLQVLLQSSKLKIAEALPLASTLVKELLNMKVKMDPATAHDSYAAWRENIHDDLVLATALACWIGEQRGNTSIGYQSLERRRSSRFFGHHRCAY